MQPDTLGHSSKSLLLAGLCASALLGAGPSAAQTAGAPAASSTLQCILAGRLNTDQRWAPQARGVELLDATGKRVASSDKTALGGVKQVRISSPALLSTCNGNQALPSGDDQAKTPKAAAAAVSANATPINVEAVGFPPLRVGGELVELRLALPSERIVSLTR
ncbi:MAG: hypothetical protein WB821_00130 [Burkholderiaceae bacterium]